MFFVQTNRLNAILAQLKKSKMKKISLFIALVSFGTITAQTEKGTFIISGQTGIGFNSTTVKYEYAGQTSDGPKTNAFNISPSVGFFIIDNLAISIELDYKTATTKQQILIPSNTVGAGFIPIDSKSKETTLSIVPTVTYFFSKGKARPYINAGMGFANINQEINSYGSIEGDGEFISSSKINNDGLVWGAGGGLAYFITNTISFDIGLAYAKYTYEEEDVKVKTGALGANIGISVFLK